MRCPICEDLHRDHSRECQLEAKAVLQQRSRLLSWLRLETRAEERETEEIVLNSRKRQIKISARIDLHKASHHAA
jgi:hypothetical protein